MSGVSACTRVNLSAIYTALSGVMPKKSFGVTAPSVSSNSFAMRSREGMIAPFAARVTVETETPSFSAKAVAETLFPAR